MSIISTIQKNSLRTGPFGWQRGWQVQSLPAVQTRSALSSSHQIAVLVDNIGAGKPFHADTNTIARNDKTIAVTQTLVDARRQRSTQILQKDHLKNTQHS